MVKHTLSYSSTLTFMIFIMQFSCVDRSESQGPSIEVANHAFSSYDYQKSLKFYRSYWYQENDALPDNRVLTAQRMAYLAWKVQRDLEATKEWSKRAVEVGVGLSKTYAAWSRYEMEAGNYEQSADLAKKSLSQARSELEKRDSGYQFCYLVSKTILKGLSNLKGDFGPAQVLITEMSKDFPEDLDVAKLQVTIALLSEDMGQLLLSWKRYYGIGGSLVDNDILKEALTVVEELPDNSSSLNELSNDDLVALCLALSDSRFFELAVYCQKIYLKDVDNTTLKNTTSYLEYLQKAEALADEFYRATALRKSDRKQFQEDLLDLQKACWIKLTIKQKESFDRTRFNQFLRKWFGSFMQQGNINGYYSFFIGHTVADEPIRINQYGQETKLQSVVIDHVVGNDYAGWFLGDLRIGGTANAGELISYRQSALQEPVTFWNYLNDPQQWQTLQRSLSQMITQDGITVNRDRYAVLPGVRMTILSRDLELVRDSLAAMGKDHKTIRLAFISYYRSFKAKGLIHHEGRHAIDFQLGGFSTDEMEYRAKLSEIAFSNKPLVMLAATAMGPESTKAAHGMANGRLIKDVVKWMEMHEQDIREFDTGQAHALQIGKLSDAQVVQIVQSLDPLIPKK